MRLINLKLKLAVAVAVIMILFQSCSKEPVPAFSYYPGFNPEAGETINFFNKSTDAKEYLWDFGNGESSTEEGPSTLYQTPGDYHVTLTAKRASKLADCVEVLTINDPTVLALILLEPDYETPLPDCRVKVYTSEEDMFSDKNVLFSTKTDENGMVTFEHLEELPYWLMGEKDIHVGVYFIWGSIPTLELNTVNLYYGVTTYTPNGEKKSANRPIMSIFENKLPL